MIITPSVIIPNISSYISDTEMYITSHMTSTLYSYSVTSIINTVTVTSTSVIVDEVCNEVCNNAQIGKLWCCRFT